MILLAFIVNKLQKELELRNHTPDVPRSNFARFYPLVFIGMFIGGLFLPLSAVTDIGNIEKAFFGREWLIKEYSGLMVKLGNVVFDNSLITRDNWLVYTGEDSLNDYQNIFPFTDDQLQTIHQKLSSLAQQLETRGIKLLIVIPPNKNTIYPEYMPTEIPIIGSQSRLDQLLAYENRFDTVRMLDLRPSLLAAKQQDWIYYHTDTHWNQFGAYIAYRDIMRELQYWYPAMHAHPITDYQAIEVTYFGEIAQNMIKYKMSENTYNLIPIFKRNYLTRTLPGGSPNTVNIMTTSSDAKLPRLLMFNDSFGLSLQPFLSDHFSHADYIWSFNIDKTYIDTEKPDVVIIEITERYLSTLLNFPD